MWSVHFESDNDCLTSLVDDDRAFLNDRCWIGRILRAENVIERIPMREADSRSLSNLRRQQR